MVTLPGRAYVAVPAALRRRCGLQPDDRVLLTALPGGDVLAAYSFALVDQAIRAHGALPNAQGEQSVTTTPASQAASQQAAVDAALLILERIGLSPDDLAAAPRQRPSVPTFADYVPVVSATVTSSIRKAYGSYWNRVVEQWGTRRLDEPTPSEIKQLVAYVRANVVPRRNARGGRSAAENLIAALPVSGPETGPPRASSTTATGPGPASPPGLADLWSPVSYGASETFARSPDCSNAELLNERLAAACRPACLPRDAPANASARKDLIEPRAELPASPGRISKQRVRSDAAREHRRPAGTTRAQ